MKWTALAVIIVALAVFVVIYYRPKELPQPSREQKPAEAAITIEGFDTNDHLDEALRELEEVESIESE